MVYSEDCSVGNRVDTDDVLHPSDSSLHSTHIRTWRTGVTGTVHGFPILFPQNGPSYCRILSSMTFLLLPEPGTQHMCSRYFKHPWLVRFLLLARL